MPRLLALAFFLVPGFAVAAPPAVTAVAYHSDGKLVAFGAADEVHLCDTAKGIPAGEPFAVAGRVTALAFDPKGRWLAVACGEAGKSGVVHLHPLEGSREPVEINAHTDAIYALAFSPDGKTLATAGYDRVIHLWELEGEPRARRGPKLTLKDHSDAVYGLSFHPGGKLLASASADRTVKVWYATTGKRLYSLGDATDWLYAVTWSPDGEHLAAAGVDRSIRVWAADAEGGKLIATAFAHEKPVSRLAYSRDGKTLYTAGEDRKVKSWDAAKLVETKVYDAQPDTILDFAPRPDGRQFALGRFDGAGPLIDATTGKMVAQPLPAKPVPPKVQSLAPDGGARGQTTRVTVTGTSLKQVKAVAANVPDVKVKLSAEKRSAKELTLDITIGEAAPIGPVQLAFEGEGGKSAPVAFAVDRFAVVKESGATDSARSAMPVTLPATLAGTLDRAGDVDYYRFTAEAGEQVGVQLVTNTPAAKFDPALALTDDKGNILAEGSASLGFAVRAKGTYALRVRDRDFRGGADVTYRLHAGNVPVVTGVFPLAVQRRRTSSVHVMGVHLGAPLGITAKLTVPADAKPGSTVPVPHGVRDAVGTATVMVSEYPSVVAAPGGADIRVPGSADGILAKPNDAQTSAFNAKKGERLVVEVLARRAGSPVDPVVEILDAAGAPVPLATLRCTAKTSVTFRDHDSANPGIRLDAWNDLGIDDYLFANGELVRILALPRGPDDDCRFYQVNGRRAAFLGTTPVHHSNGEAMYKVEFHPPGATFPPNGLPVFTLYHRNDDGGPGFGKDSFLVFDPPADGTFQVRVGDARGDSGPAHAYRVTVRPPKPGFTVRASAAAPNLLKGGAVPVDVTIDRIDGFDGTVAVELKGVPEGFTASSTSIESGHESATLALFGASDAAVPVKPKAVLVATATIAGKEVVHEVPIVLPAKAGTGDIVTTVRQQAVTIKPGHEARFTVDVARQGKFAGRVPIEVQNLPHGVRVLNVGLNGILVTERETSREVVLFAEPWVKPVERRIVVLARREGTRGAFAAKPVTLTVQK